MHLFGIRDIFVRVRTSESLTKGSRSGVERPDPKAKGLSTFSQCTESLPHRGFEHMSSRSGVRRYN
jgi:hypothetical protein